MSDIEIWIEAKGLSGTLDATAVYNSILKNGTLYDRIGGVKSLKQIINDTNVKRVMNIFIDNAKNELLK